MQSSISQLHTRLVLIRSHYILFFLLVTLTPFRFARACTAGASSWDVSVGVTYQVLPRFPMEAWRQSPRVL